MTNLSEGYRLKARILVALTIAVVALILGQEIAFGQSVADDRQFTIDLRSRTFTPEPGATDFLAEAINKAKRIGPHHIMVQLEEPPKHKTVRAIESSGIRLLSYINGNAYYALVARPRDHRRRPSGSHTVPSVIRWAGPIQPDDRVEPAILKGHLNEYAFNEDGTVKLRLLFFEDVELEEQSELLGRFSEDLDRQSDHIWRLNIDPQKITGLITEDIVEWIEQEPPPPEPLNDVTRQSIGVETVQGFQPSGPAFYHGGGIQVMVCDSGIDETHEDFEGRILANYNPNPSSMHGTKVAGIIAGSGFRSVDYKWRGMAPEAELISTDMYFMGKQEIISDFGVDISNHSHAFKEYSQYDLESHLIDGTIRNDRVYVVGAAGNNGYFPQTNVGGPTGYFSITGTVAKNVLSVGAYNNRNSPDEFRPKFSSMGPTFDGRIKPDLVAPGPGAMTTADNNGYDAANGTSSAAPCVSGILALMLDAYCKHFTVDCDFDVVTDKPLFSTMRAILIQTTKDLVQPPNDPDFPDCPDFQSNPQPAFFHAGPDWASGYGLVDAAAAVETIEKKRFLEGEVDLISYRDEFLIAVGSDQSELKVTLAWDDPSGRSSTSNEAQKLVNDLDLMLIPPKSEGQKVMPYLPWVLEPLDPADDCECSRRECCDWSTKSCCDGIDWGVCEWVNCCYPSYLTCGIDPAEIVPATRGKDHVNNVEQVSVVNPQQGTWTVRVEASALRRYSEPQAYSLATNVEFVDPLGSLPQHWSLAARLGFNWPIEAFDSTYDPDLGLDLSLEYRFDRRFSVRGLVGYHSFRTANASPVEDQWWNISANVKYELGVSRNRPYLVGGPGVYIAGESGSSNFGFNVGFGLDRRYGANWSLVVEADYHQISEVSGDVRFVTSWLGFAHRF